MIRVGNAHIGSGVGHDIGNHILVDFAVIRIGPDFHGNIGIEGFKILLGLFVNGFLGGIRVVFGPKADGVLPGGVEGEGGFPGP